MGRLTSWYKNQIESQRRDKDHAFRTAHWSPILEADRAAFKGLRYYPVDEAFRFRLQIERAPPGEEVRMGTSDGDVRVYERYGTLRFALQSVECALAGYVSPDRPDPNLFLPFRDATSGKETYGAARYLDLEPSPDGYFELDFNAAYNPYCAYNETYSCPLAPTENWLKVAIPAGEKLYK